MDVSLHVCIWVIYFFFNYQKDRLAIKVYSIEYWAVLRIFYTSPHRMARSRCTCQQSITRLLESRRLNFTTPSPRKNFPRGLSLLLPSPWSNRTSLVESPPIFSLLYQSGCTNSLFPWTNPEVDRPSVRSFRFQERTKESNREESVAPEFWRRSELENLWRSASR